MTYLHRLNESDFMDEGCPTVRRHPRSLAEAFPDERAAAVERPAKPFRMSLADLAVIGVSLACLLIAAVMAVHGWLPHE